MIVEGGWDGEDEACNSFPQLIAIWENGKFEQRFAPLLANFGAVDRPGDGQREPCGFVGWGGLV